MKISKTLIAGIACSCLLTAMGGKAVADETKKTTSSETSSSDTNAPAKAPAPAPVKTRRANRNVKKNSKVTTSTTTKTDDTNSTDYKVQAEKTRADAKVDAADAKVEAAEIRAKAKVEAAEIKAKTKTDEVEARAKMEKETTEARAATKIDTAEIRASADKDATDTRNSAKFGELSHSGRLSHRFGAYLSMWGDPFPAPIGLNVAYNVYDFLRANIGVGSNDDRTFSLSTVGAGVKGVVPDWALTPVVGLNVSTTMRGSTGANSIRGFDPTGTRAYGTVGLDWQAGMGLNFAAGYAHSFRGGENGTIFFNAGIFL